MRKKKAIRASTDLRVVTANGAPWRDSKYPLLQPCNVVVVFGPPGKNIVADTIGAKLVEAANPADPTHANGQIGEDNYTTFHVYIDSDSLQSLGDISRAAATVTISNALDPNDCIGPLPLQFKPYTRSATNTVILGYGCTSGAPADGQTRAAVYVGVDMKTISSKYRYVTVQLPEGSGAWIDGFGDTPTDHKIPLNDDGTATAFIVSDQPQTGLKIEISTPVGMDIGDLTMDFVAVPTSN
jgi:hypothetical protein